MILEMLSQNIRKIFFLENLLGPLQRESYFLVLERMLDDMPDDEIIVRYLDDEFEWFNVMIIY